MFAGQVGLVTGAGSGIGRAVAQALAERGMRVGCADINAAAAEETAKNLDGALAITMDVRDQDSCEAAVEATITRFDRLHGKARAPCPARRPRDRPRCSFRMRTSSLRARTGERRFRSATAPADRCATRCIRRLPPTRRETASRCRRSPQVGPIGFAHLPSSRPRDDRAGPAFDAYRAEKGRPARCGPPQFVTR